MAPNAAALFGKIAVERGHLTAEQLETLLKEQSDAAQAAQTLLLGDLCIRKGFLTQNQVRRILESQRNGDTGGETTNLGALAIRNGLATPQEIDLALEAQKSPEGEEAKEPPRLGEILLAMGTLTPQEQKALLAAQTRIREPGADGAGEFEFDTREVPAVPSSPAPPAGAPVAWLIQESGEGTGQLFRIGPSATLGRMPTHDVAVADMGASREHAAIELAGDPPAHVLRDLDSRNGTFVNDAQLVRPRPLRTGDLIRIGETLFRYASAAPAEQGTALGARLARAAALLRGAAARVLPGLHAQRKGFVLACVAGALASFLPWVRVAEQGSVLGVRTAAGWVTLLLFSAAAVVAFLRDRSRPLDRPFLFALLGAASLAAVVGILRLATLAVDPAASAGLGVPLAILAGLSVPVALWFTRVPIAPPVTWGGKTEAPAAPGAWARVRVAALRAGETTVRVVKSLARRKPGGTPSDADRRDALLEELGRAALAAAPGPGADPARKAEESLRAARERLEKVGKETSSRDLLIARNEVKWAEGRLQRALRKLGRQAVDQPIPLEGRQAEVEELRTLDARLGGKP